MENFTITSEDINIDAIRDSVQDPQAGGFCSFEGWVRNHHDGHEVDSLEYSAYIPLAHKEGNQIIADAVHKFDIIHAKCTHKIGHLKIGDLAVSVSVSAAHRDAAFAACRYIIDEIKVRVPIWKKEFYTNGKTAWPNCKGCQHNN